MKKAIDQPQPSEADAIKEQETAIFAAEVSGLCPNIDLHGLDREDAALEVDRVVNAAFMAGEPVVKIIHGRGSSILRAAVHGHLERMKREGLVEYYRDANSPEQKGGVTFAVVAKRK